MAQSPTNFFLSDDKSIAKVDPPEIVWVPVRDAIGLLWDENPKLHDIGSVVQSIDKYGFQELPKFDRNLINVSGTQGAIKAGNGRIEALRWMEKEERENVPRGIGVDEAGVWYLPLVVGTDAKDELEAKAYAIDSNNLTMTGGDFTMLDYVRMWEPRQLRGLIDELSAKASFPVTLGAEDYDFLMQYFSDFDGYKDEYFDPEENVLQGEYMHTLRVRTLDIDQLEEITRFVRQYIDDHGLESVEIDLG